METGSRRIVVLPRVGGGWELRETRTGPGLARSATKHEAVVRARLMLEPRGGEVVVLGPDGTAVATHPVGAAPPRPWWYLRPGITRWLVPLIVVPSTIRSLASWRTGALDAVLGVLGLVLLVLVAVCLSRSVALDRTRTARDDQG